MKFLFRKKWKQGKTYSAKLPWVVIQTDLLEAGVSSSRSSSRASSRSSSPCPEAESGGVGWWCWRACGCVWVARVAQMALVLALVAVTTHVILAALTPVLLTPSRPLVPALSAHALPQPSPSSLLELPHFRYLQEAPGACSSARLFFVFLVHSRPDHFRQREAIRSTWGGHRDLGGGWTSVTVFMLGQGPGGGSGNSDGGGDRTSDEDEHKSEGDVVRRVEKEGWQHGDLVVGNFVDHYHNLTYKHIMTLRWAVHHCPHATYLVKADDDAFIDVPALQARLLRTFSVPPPRRTLACNVLPEGTQPQREGKWAVSEQDYPWPEYPSYCAGLAYVTTPYLAQQLASVAEAGVAPRVWVDDVWVTGLVAAALRLTPYYLNLRYSYDHQELVSWAANARPWAPPPYTFVHLDAGLPDWRSTLITLWRHALNAHNNTTPSPFTALSTPS